MEENRPNPELLLKKLRKEEEKREKERKGKLKIFLGYAAGVGKTYAMLEAAQTLRDRGQEVVAGYIEPHDRPATLAMAEGLETLPPFMVEYKGIRLREFDLDGALKRKPKLILVDELAHTNAPGLRHEKRYQDVNELLQAGISVYTTLNIQHLESLNDQVGSITGIRVRERIPDGIFDQADQVELIDIEPSDLLQRLKEGKIYHAVQAERALDHFFAEEKLIALREIALRRTADRVNRLAVMERENRGGADYYTGEHVLTCISPSPTCAKVIRTASRLAYPFRGEFTALYVETPSLQHADPKVRQMVEENIHLAKALGARIA
ncbi:MAG: sensor histidine kinase KdpD, partial [Enterocloster sp.]|nr:sensor histidine kinase KdpD [Enterocloster sp.]